MNANMWETDKLRAMFVPKWPKKTLILTERHKLLLHKIWHYNLLNTFQIKTWCDWMQGFYRSDPEKARLYSPEAAEKDLRELFHFGYLIRPPKQVQLWVDPSEIENHFLVYRITQKGVRALGETTKSKLSWKGQKLSLSNIKHGLFISDFRLTLELACLDKNVKLLFWKRDKSPELEEFLYLGWQRDPDGKPRRKLLRDSAGNVVRQVYVGRLWPRSQNERFPYPDGAFLLEFLGKRSLFFFEADTGSLPRRRIKEKFRRYLDYYRRRKAFLKHRGRELDEREKQEQLLGFRVLIVTRDQRRKGNLLQWLAEMIAQRNYSAVDPFRGARLFYVAAREDVINLNQPWVMWQKVWDTPHPDDHPRSILPA